VIDFSAQWRERTIHEQVSGPFSLPAPDRSAGSDEARLAATMILTVDRQSHASHLMKVGGRYMEALVHFLASSGALVAMLRRCVAPPSQIPPSSNA
jgi:hypothetical protein